MSAVLLEAFTQYRSDVKERAFPQQEHIYSMVAGEADRLREAYGEAATPQSS